MFTPRQPKIEPVPVIAEVKTFRAIDLEGTGVDVSTVEVAQVAIDSAPAVGGGCPDLDAVKTSMVYCSVTEMPAAATKINKLTFEELQGHKPFGVKVRGVMKALTSPGVVIVTFNGARYDLAVIARYAAAHGRLGSFVDASTKWSDKARGEAYTHTNVHERFEGVLEERHIDVARLWQVARARKTVIPWEVSYNSAYPSYPPIHAGGFNGTLTGAHMFWQGRDFDGAHDASADNRATLRILHEMLLKDFVTVAEALRLTSSPLPGDVDFDGVFKWDGDQAVCKLAKHRDEPIEKIDRGFLTWMLEPARTFHRHTKQVVRDYLAGHYPIRDYENENTT